ncbi:MAG TPA: cysteine--tRNA ligase [Cytophagales bacterium]|nr:cysteine--tRNA ligase [Cytophagales bacterium]
MSLHVYNTLTRQKEKFEPINAPFVGMYVCGPTVYGDPHLGHARSAITFDIVYRYLCHLGYKVRYVRNITDVGHLENDADEGDDKIAKKARLEQLEPMEVAQSYTNNYHRDMDKLNVKRPSIEPRATGHIIEQIETIQNIIKNGFAYESKGSVYFDVETYHKKYSYGKLSGRVIDDLRANTRELDGQSEKRSPLDFALWKKANPEHIMRWSSPWGTGFPGWHIECTAMSTKYLGTYFDIHGGGMDLTFPHHECEIAQAEACCSSTPAKYWLHNNMITIDGKKMGKSYGNFINLDEFFSGAHALLEQAYSPMTIRLYILQAQYRSTLDISNTSLKAAQVAYRKLLNTYKTLNKITYIAQDSKDDKLTADIEKAIAQVYEGMNDDFNTGVTLSGMFAMAGYINQFFAGQKLTGAVENELFEKLLSTFRVFFEDVLGLVEESYISPESTVASLLEIYKEAKAGKQYDKVDQIRTLLKKEGIAVKDMRGTVDWSYEV